METTWVVVADSTRCRIFTCLAPGERLHELEALAHPESRLHDREITSDLPGRTFDRHGQGRHAMEPPADPHRHEAEVFARLVAERLHATHRAQAFGRLVLVAPPRFLGMLRGHLDAETARAIVLELPKSLIREAPDAISARVFPKPKA